MTSGLFELGSSAVFSPCGTWRYLLERDVAEIGVVFAFFGVNGSTAGIKNEDQTSMKWRGFTLRNAGRRYVAANPFAYCTTDVHELAGVEDPIGPENDAYISAAIAVADVLVPCWGSRGKLPRRLHYRLDWLKAQIFAAGKPVRIFGLTASGDPKHPLMLGYDTKLQDWTA